MAAKHKRSGISARVDRQGRTWRGLLIGCEGFRVFPSKSVTIDFNNAYNPNCTRSAHFTCPVTVDNIALPLKAGERDPHSAH